LAGTSDNQDQTFLFADLAGFTAMTEAHGDVAAADAVAEFFAIVARLLGEHGAEQVKTLGDAVMARVDDAADAVQLGVRVIEDVSERHGALGVRVGLNTGPAVERDGDSGTARLSTWRRA
jgi:class 3 adenylate cyclase